MGKVTILPETTQHPITLIGQRAGICYGSDVSDEEKNYRRGMDCIKSMHGRTLEFVNVEMILDGYSARVIREWYTHIAGGPTRLQSSTRYINYHDFDYVVPKTIRKNTAASDIYKATMATISEACQALEGLGISREDTAMLLPLGMSTKVVDKRTLRSLVDMSHQRLCTRAYWEYRELFDDLTNALAQVSEEWQWITDHLFAPKCQHLGYCPEKKSCGRYKAKEI